MHKFCQKLTVFCWCCFSLNMSPTINVSSPAAPNVTITNNIQVTNSTDLGVLTNIVGNSNSVFAGINGMTNAMAQMGTAAAQDGAGKLGSLTNGLAGFAAQVEAGDLGGLQWDIQAGSHTIHLNPVSHDWVIDMSTIVRTAIAWLSFMGLIIYCGNVLGNGVERSGAIRQASSAGVTATPRPPQGMELCDTRPSPGAGTGGTLVAPGNPLHAAGQSDHAPLTRNGSALFLVPSQVDERTDPLTEPTQTHLSLIDEEGEGY